MRNTIYRIAFACLASLVIFACQQVTPVQFEVDTEDITIGPEGGVKVVKIKSADNWIATVQEPWLTISPANGVGSVDCRVIIDSALAVNQREAIIRINNQVTDERMDFKVIQNGFDYQIVLSEPEVNIASYASLEDREFDVKVKSNVPFDVELPEGAESWLTYTLPELVLDRGVRPREVAVHFKWGVNFNPTARDAVIKFNPKDPQVTPAIKNDLKIQQEAAEEIEIGVKGDSLALIAINRALGCWTEFETSEKMEFWDGVKVWESGENKGRVRSARFFMFGTKESIPFQVKYLNAAEELYFYSNTNTFLLSLDPGEHICELTQLRKLTIGAYGLTSLPESFKNLRNLEYLDISSNNFQTVPEILTPENFPNLTALIINACQRNTISDLSNTTKKGFGGLFEETDVDADGNKTFPKRLLKWSNLDTLRLSVNYLEGTIPDLEDDPDFPKWTAEEVNACDTLPAILIGKPKVLPDTELFAINLNRLYGTIPDWLLYHPKLDLWYPYSLVFLQEGVASDGTRAGFDNEPANLDYYYEHYVNKLWNPANNK